jgi:hypothetical protein
MIRESYRIALLLVVGLVLAGLSISHMVGCTSSQQTEVQGQITVLAEIIDPSYDLAIDGCVAAEKAQVAAERDGEQAPAETDKQLAKIRARCDQLRRTFDQMVAWLAEAEKALGDKDPERAKARLEEVRATWRSLH